MKLEGRIWRLGSLSTLLLLLLSTRIVYWQLLHGEELRPVAINTLSYAQRDPDALSKGDRITEEALRASFLSLQKEQHYSRAASTIALCGITFFYEPTLKRAWTTLTFVRPPQEHQLPVILSRDAVRPLLQGVR